MITSASSAICLMSTMCNRDLLDWFQEFLRVDIQIIQYRKQVDVFLFRLRIVAVFCHDDQVAVVPVLDRGISFQRIGRFEPDGSTAKGKDAEAVAVS